MIEKLKIELPGILNWCIEGCRIWMTEGLNPPKEILDATNEYRFEMDKMQQFFEAATSEAVDKWLSKYNQLVRQLSSFIILYEKLTGKKMTESEIFNGFYIENMSPEALLVTKEAKQ